MWFLIATLAMTASEATSEIKPDEDVILFPTCAHLDTQSGAWIVPVHGWIFEPEYDSLRRAATLRLFRRALGLTEQDEETAIFKYRARFFLVDNERRKQILIRIGDNTYKTDESEANGHFETILRIPANQLQTRPADPVADGQWLSVDVVMPKKDDRHFHGSVQLLQPRGVSVISDIDDTVKISNVASHKALMANTFMKEFEAVPGMAAAYQAWMKGGASFHYVSASPWQLYPPFAEFFAKEGLPAGTFHLKLFRVKDSSFLNLFEDPLEYKPGVIEPILKAFPHRRFVLVGDSGEKDPEIYGQLARSYPDQILRIFIRDVTGDSPDSDRYQEAFKGIPTGRWRIFHQASELPASINP